MASLSLKNICKVYPNGFEAVKDFNLEIEDKEFVIFVGPSGCGKSTTLRMIAGFQEPDSGDVLFEGKKINGVPPHKRQLNTIFQRYALFPHLNVYENIAYGLKLKRFKSTYVDKNGKTLIKPEYSTIYIPNQSKDVFFCFIVRKICIFKFFFCHIFFYLFVFFFN